MHIMKSIILCKVHIFWEGHNLCEISTLLWSYVVLVKSKVEILQNFVSFSEYMNFTQNKQINEKTTQKDDEPTQNECTHTWLKSCRTVANLVGHPELFTPGCSSAV